MRFFHLFPRNMSHFYRLSQLLHRHRFMRLRRRFSFRYIFGFSALV